MQDQDSIELDLRLFRVWRNASKAVIENIRKDIESHKISAENFMTLELLFNKGPHPVQKISEKLSIPSGSITYVVNKLEQKKLVERKPNPTDQRAFDVHLTEEGRILFAELFPKHVEKISQNFAFISNQEKEQLIELLKKIGLGSQNIK